MNLNLVKHGKLVTPSNVLVRQKSVSNIKSCNIIAKISSSSRWFDIRSNSCSKKNTIMRREKLKVKTLLIFELKN